MQRAGAVWVCDVAGIEKGVRVAAGCPVCLQHLQRQKFGKCSDRGQQSTRVHGGLW